MDRPSYRLQTVPCSRLTHSRRSRLSARIGRASFPCTSRVRRRLCLLLVSSHRHLLVSTLPSNKNSNPSINRYLRTLAVQLLLLLTSHSINMDVTHLIPARYLPELPSTISPNGPSTRQLSSRMRSPAFNPKPLCHKATIIHKTALSPSTWHPPVWCPCLFLAHSNQAMSCRLLLLLSLLLQLLPVNPIWSPMNRMA